MQSSILPSMIAGIFALIALYITKRNKVSEFRQAWIDAIRQELSEFCSNARALGSLLDQGQGLVSERKTREEQMQKVKRLLASEDKALRTAIGEEHRTQLQKLIDFEVEVDRKLDPCLEKCRTNYYKIRLRLNLAEGQAAPDPLHVQMEERLRAIIEVLGRGLQQETFIYEDLLNDIDALLAVSSRMLKHEWERVKAGDFQHRVFAAYRRVGSASLPIVRND